MVSRSLTLCWSQPEKRMMILALFSWSPSGARSRAMACQSPFLAVSGLGQRFRNFHKMGIAAFPDRQPKINSSKIFQNEREREREFSMNQFRTEKNYR